MDPIAVIELCRKAASDDVGVPVGFNAPFVFNAGEYQDAWRRNPTRVRKLIDELLCAPRADEGLELLARFGVIQALFPEVDAIVGMGDEGGLHKDVWSHTKAVVMGVPNVVELRWGALLHDIGKAKTRRIVRGRVTFHNHDQVGARMVDAMQARTNLFQNDTALLRTVRLLVMHHLRPAGYKASWSDSAIRRLVTECGDPRFFQRLMSLSRADLTTKVPARRSRALARAQELEDRVNTVIVADNAPRLPKGTMGAIIDRVAAKPGPWVNAVRAELEEMMKVGLLPADQGIDFYVAEGLKLVEVHAG